MNRYRESDARWESIKDPQLWTYYNRPHKRYREMDREIRLSMRLSHKACTGEGCDGDGYCCPRHDRIAEVVARYVRRYPR